MSAGGLPTADGWREIARRLGVAGTLDPRAAARDIVTRGEGSILLVLEGTPAQWGRAVAAALSEHEAERRPLPGPGAHRAGAHRHRSAGPRGLGGRAARGRRTVVARGRCSPIPGRAFAAGAGRWPGRPRGLVGSGAAPRLPERARPRPTWTRRSGSSSTGSRSRSGRGRRTRPPAWAPRRPSCGSWCAASSRSTWAPSGGPPGLATPFNWSAPRLPAPPTRPTRPPWPSCSRRVAADDPWSLGRARRAARRGGRRGSRRAGAMAREPFALRGRRRGPRGSLAAARHDPPRRARRAGGRAPPRRRRARAAPRRRRPRLRLQRAARMRRSGETPSRPPGCSGGPRAPRGDLDHGRSGSRSPRPAPRRPTVPAASGRRRGAGRGALTRRAPSPTRRASPRRRGSPRTTCPPGSAPAT